MNTLSHQQSTDKKTPLWGAIKGLETQRHHRYGSRRMAKALHMQGYPVGRYRAGRLMGKAGICCLQRQRYVMTTQRQPGSPAASHPLHRQFRVDAPHRVGGVDITSLSTQEGWLYLAIVLDWFSRRIIGGGLAEHLRETWAGNALQRASVRRRPTTPLMHHSDRGCPYTSTVYQARLKPSGLVISLRRTGNGYDTAVAERFLGSLTSKEH